MALPTSEPARPGAGVDRSTVRRIVEAFRPYRGQVALVVMLILVGSGVGVINPLLIKVVFDTALFPPGNGGPDLDRLWFLAGIMIVLPVMGGTVGLVQTWRANV